MVNTDTEQYRAFLQKLQRDEFRPSALNDIKNLLAFKPPSEASVVIRDAGITEIVQCLNVADRIQVDLTCEVLKLCFEKFEVGDIIRQYTGHVMYLLRHEKSCVRRLAVDEVIVNISSRSPELLQLSAEHGYLDKLVSELDTDDVLYHLNILELMTRLATTQQGINHIVKHGALKKVGELVTDLPNNPLCGLTTPGYMKFFGVIAHKYPQEIFTKYPVLLNLMFDTIDSQDQATLPIALDTLAFVGSTIEGKLSLAALGSQYTQAVGKVAQMITTGTSDIKVRALHCFASLVGVDTGTDAPKTRPIDHRVTLMTREWFRTLSVQPGPMEVLVEICKNPFPDIRSAGFSLLDAVCQHQWGEELVARTAGFVEFLLDRSVSFTKELKESKYDIVKRLSHSLAFDNNTVLRLQLYVEQGPFYSETEMQVATEEGD
ncbi:26S proteasome non-ATPase regulatory subunit 5 isoform X2 [Choristoneura fumiferana]|uniref:26S proteasome non-ATPase regulatory subunit 5 isoform X2 n=1 Tax=Choristoneura fumiferana TaxID=7141 RepID=UPI003D15D414